MKEFKSVLFCCLLTLFAQTAAAQRQSVIDSLCSLLKSNDDTFKVNVLNALAYQWRNNDPDKGIEYSVQAIQISNKINYSSGAARANVLLGIANANMGNGKEAFKCFSLAKEIAIRIGDNRIAAEATNNIGLYYDSRANYTESLKNYGAALDLLKGINEKKGMADCYENIGVTYCKMSKYKEALENDSVALRLRAQCSDTPGLCSSLNALSMAYRFQGDYAEAAENLLAALKMAEETNDKLGMAISYQNLGNVYGSRGDGTAALKNYLIALNIHQQIKNKTGTADSYGNIGYAYFILGNTPEALKSFQTSVKIAIEIDYKLCVAQGYGNIAFLYKQTGNYPEAFDNLRRAIKLSGEIEDKEGLAEWYETMGETYGSMHNHAAAILWLNKSIKTAREIDSKRTIKESYAALAGVYENLNDYKNAFKYHTLYTDIKDSIDEESGRKIEAMSLKYQTEKRDDKIKLLNKDKEIQQAEISRQKFARNVFSGGFCVVLLFAGVFFVQRNRISKERNRSEHLLLNILPAEVAEELKEKGSAETKLFDNVTVLFTDFKDFTHLSERLAPDALVAELHHCFKAFDEIMAAHGIEKIKTIGDAYMAVSGLPTPNESHAEAAVKAAFEMRNFIMQRRNELGEATFEMRTGLHSGKVVAGIVGVKKFAYDIWGDTVNTAARMEQAGVAGKVNISETTYQLVKDNFQCTYRGKVAAKNKGEVDMYFVEPFNTI